MRNIKTCGCGTIFHPTNQQLRLGRGEFCSRKCAGTKVSLRLKGVKKSDLHVQHMRLSRIGKRLGSQNPNWRGGEYVSRGRFFVRNPTHPNAGQNGYLERARFVVSEKLGRALIGSETVHHINENKLDDQLINLYLFPSDSEHTLYHQLRKKNENKEITTSNLL